MPRFKSKTQYKNYEKGEFIDEKIRSLEETIELIKNFPWATERGVDIQLTGPSVTIEDEYFNYLKVSLYFNGKFCLYYLDCDNHLYEYHVEDLLKACAVVSRFFNGELDLQKFDKHLFSVGSKSHFESASFEYSLSSSSFVLYFLLMLVFSTIAFGGTIAFFMVKDMPWPMIVFYIFLDGLIFSAVYSMLKIYSMANDMFINVSAGQDEFRFRKGNTVRDYNKNDISSINIYGGGKSSLLDLMEIVFKDESIVKIPGILIDQYLFRAKFRSVKVSYISGYFRRIREISDSAK